MSNLSTPKTSFKKRPVSSPEDSVEVKKLKPIPEMDEVTYPSSGMSANVANLTLSTEDLQAMAILIKDFIKAEILEFRVDNAEQYSRRNCLCLRGIPEATTASTENTDEYVLQMSDKLLQLPCCWRLQQSFTELGI